MAIITQGSISDFSVQMVPGTLTRLTGLTEVDTFGTLAEVSNTVAADTFRFAASAESRGLALSSMRLDPGFQGFLARLLNSTSDIYFIAWCWDLSGRPVAVYPASGASADSSLIPLKGGQLREFIGAGAVLFHARQVTAGLGVRLQIWESKKRKRDFGKALAEVSGKIQQSNLNSLLRQIATFTSVPTATIALIEQAALELGKTIGTVLQAMSDDYVDFYEGYFPASDPWPLGKGSYKGSASEIVLSHFS
jgi:hypothetical protein